MSRPRRRVGLEAIDDGLVGRRLGLLGGPARRRRGLKLGVERVLVGDRRLELGALGLELSLHAA